jgi:predicted amino acid dehydrogenase
MSIMQTQPMGFDEGREAFHAPCQATKQQLWGDRIADFDGFIPTDKLIDLSNSSVMDCEYWKPDYNPEHYNRDKQLRKLADVADLLRADGRVATETIDRELAESLERTSKTFAIYEGQEAPDFDGSFAFIVPTRIDRNSAEYGDEILPYLTILRHVDNATRQLVLAGTCPWVLDIYGNDGVGKQGAMVFAPVFKNLMEDAPDLAAALATAHSVIDDTVRFTQERLGVTVAGLGATLPMLTHLATKMMGLKLEVPGLTTTSGHGGTVWLLNETINEARNQLIIADSDQIGIIGTGGIGRSTADYILDGDKAATVNLYDKDLAKMALVARELGEKYGPKRVHTAQNIRSLLDHRGIIVSAVTSPIELSDPVFEGLNLEGTFILDDSQPHGVDRIEVESRGGHVGWVIGHDGTPGGTLTFTNGFDYGGWGPAKRDEVWGCQAEAGAIYFQSSPEAASMKAVTPESARRIGALCRQSGVSAAQLQSFGKYI